MIDKIKFDAEMAEFSDREIKKFTDYLAKYISKMINIRELPAVPTNPEESLKYFEGIPFSREGRDASEVINELIEKGYNTSLMLQHPRCFSFVTSAMSPYSYAGTIISELYNTNTGGFGLSPAISYIEEKLVSWMGSLAGYDDKCGGLFTSGGSLSNLTGFIAARDNILDETEYPIGVAYISDQTHSSAKKGLHMMGLRRNQIVVIPTDDDYKMRVDILEESIKKDIADGKKPFLVVASIGTTNTGSIDSLQEIGAIKEKYGMWMHIDGAYGGSILFSDIYRNLAKGVELSDSLSWDTHKWAMQTYSCSTLIAKNKKNLIKVFAEHPEYLEDIIQTDHTDGWDMGIEMSRPARSVKLWLTVQSMGTDLLSDVIDYAFFNSHQAKSMIDKLKGWEITSQPSCGTITFRYAPTDVECDRYDDLNLAISNEIIREGYAYIVTTVIKEKRVLRLNMINAKSTDQDIIDTISKLDEIARRLKPLFVKV